MLRILLCYLLLLTGSHLVGGLWVSLPDGHAAFGYVILFAVMGNSFRAALAALLGSALTDLLFELGSCLFFGGWKHCRLVDEVFLAVGRSNIRVGLGVLLGSMLSHLLIVLGSRVVCGRWKLKGKLLVLIG